ncbi:MAG: 2,3-bisphosphoglycerate-dependent phosphoglycerate mutase, partial [Acidimicrobiia bacterium]|nr:2,3-bisphosphoglycerate-dependent phosphoglycerate mutase [Acidimicrobiia bacterium]
DPDDPRHPRKDPAYADLAPDVLPATECLKDVVSRVLPYWHDRIVPQLRRGLVPLVVCHGNSIRGLLKYLDGIPDAEISSLNIPTGIPLLYGLDADLNPTGSRYLGDPRAAAEAAARVAAQAAIE